MKHLLFVLLCGELTAQSNPVIEGLQRGIDVREQRARIEILESLNKSSKDNKRRTADLLDQLIDGNTQTRIGLTKLSSSERESFAGWVVELVAFAKRAGDSSQTTLLRITEGGRHVVLSDGSIWVISTDQAYVEEWKANDKVRHVTDQQQSFLLHGDRLIRVSQFK